MRRTPRTLLAALLLVSGSTGCNDDPGAGPDPSPAPSPSASDTVRSVPEWDGVSTGEVPLEPGDYLVPSSSWAVADFTVSFPEGWTAQYGHVYATGGEEEGTPEIAFYAVQVDKVFTDSCSPDDETEQPVGPAVDDLYTALQEQLGGAAISEPVSTTFGGYPATRFDMSVPRNVDVEACRMGPVGLQVWYSEPADKYFVLLEWAEASVYVVDIDGERQVFLVQVDEAATTADRDELQTVLDSIRIDGSQEPT